MLKVAHLHPYLFVAFALLKWTIQPVSEHNYVLHIDMISGSQEITYGHQTCLMAGMTIRDIT